tara:strand:- start:556 stop:6747 length:6192 start_codon:yes stop_codon:yes gene_type:complete
MAKCFNRNTEAYKILEDKYKLPVLVDSIIEGYQNTNDVEVYPSIEQAEEYLEEKRILFSLKKKKFIDTVYSNLRRAKLIRRYGNTDTFTVNVTNEKSKLNYLGNQQYEFKGSAKIANDNKTAILRRLISYGIKSDAAMFVTYGKTFIFSLDPAQIKNKDIITREPSKNKTYIRQVTNFLSKKFPNLNIEYVTDKDAQDYYNNLDDAQRPDAAPKYTGQGSVKKKKINWKNVRSFYDPKANKIKLINKKVTDDSAVEEVLHPFVDAFKSDNPKLYLKLVKEAKENFPNLWEQIKDQYNTENGFTIDAQERELVTQALALKFLKKYDQIEEEIAPRKRWDELGFEFMKWFANMIREFFKYLTGTPIKIRVRDINYNTTLSDIAKVLNTTNIGFTFETPTVVLPENEVIKFSLEPKKKDALSRWRKKATPAQLKTLERLLGISEAHKEMIIDYNASGSSGQGGIIQLDEPTHTYSNLLDKDQKFKSVTTIIKGTLKQKHIIKKNETLQDILNKYSIEKENIINLNDSTVDLDKLQNADGSRMREIYIPDTEFIINRQIGNEFDSLLTAIANYATWDDVQSMIETGEMEIIHLTQNDALFNAYMQLTEVIAGLRGMNDGGRAIIVPQLIVGDVSAGIAGSIDIAVIKADGSISIKDLKVSRNDVVGNKASNELYRNSLKGGWSVGPESKFWKTGNYRERTSPERRRGIEYKPNIHQFELTTKQQHSMQLFSYGRLLYNLGENVNFDEMETIHIHVNVKGKGKNQTWDGTFGEAATMPHKQSENSDLLDKIIPLNVNEALKEQQKKDSKEAGTDNLIMDPELIEGIEAPLSESQKDALYDALYDHLTTEQGIMIEKKEAIQRERDRVKLLEGDKEVVDNIEGSIQLIHHILDDENFIQEGLQELLEKISEEIESFRDYVQDPKNWDKPEYVRRLLNFPSFVGAVRGLVNIRFDEKNNDSETWRLLNSRTKDSIIKLIGLINSLDGTRTQTGVTTGVISDGINNYISEIVRKRSINPKLAALRKEDEAQYRTLWEDYNKLQGVKRDKFYDKLNEKEKEWLDSRIELDQILKMGVDLGSISANIRSLAVTDDTLVQVMEKTWKAKKQELLDKIEANGLEIGTAAANLMRVRQRLGLGVDPRSMYEYMLNFDEDGQFKGTYVNKIGDNYNKKEKELRDQLFTADGEYKTYIYYEDKDRSLTSEEIEYNIKLSEVKRKQSNFWKAEVINEDGTVSPGEYHHYSPQFISARNKYEEIIITGNYRRWERKANIPEADWRAYKDKYFEKRSYYRRINGNDGFSGYVVRDRDDFVKREYRVVNDNVTTTGEDLQSARYKAIMNPAMNNELAQAERTFYEVYDEYYKKFLDMLPIGVRNDMTGRVPMIMDTFYNKLKEAPNPVGSLFSKLNPAEAFKSFIKDTAISKQVFVNEDGNFINSLPIYYVGKPKQQKYVDGLNEKLEILEKQFNAGKLTGRKGEQLDTKKQYDFYLKEKKRLEGSIQKVQMAPAAHEISMDLADSLIRFSLMAQNYETMYEVEHTLKAFLDVISRREYKEPQGNLYTKLGGKVQNVFRKKDSEREPRMIQRVKKWMSMVYYDNDQLQRTWADKAVSQLIQKSSLIYVGWNPFGNINNYMIGRLNNFVEVAGDHFYDRAAYIRAEKEFNIRVAPDIMHRLGGRTALNDITNLGQGKAARYLKHIAISKYEGTVDTFRMMDKKSDIREQGDTTGRQGWFSRMAEWGFVVQDSMEYNVQTKVGVAVLMSWRVRKKGGTETMSLYDALQFDRKTGQVNLDPNEWVVIDYRTGEEREWSDDTRYEIRNYIRETNKQIHGNYAHEDRMVIQAHWLGQLAAQFHKWVVPAYDARFRREYFDENMGWLEGRYVTAWGFLKYIYQVRNHVDKNSLKKGYFEGKKGEIRRKNMWKLLAEIGVIAGSWALRDLLTKLIDEDNDDKSRTRKRLENMMLYQLHRQQSEFVQFIPVFGWPDAWKMVSSPFASSRWLYEVGEAFRYTLGTPVAMGWAAVDGEEGWVKFNEDKSWVYQRGRRKGKLKIWKEWKDALPILYAIERFMAYDTARTYWVK